MHETIACVVPALCFENSVLADGEIKLVAGADKGPHPTSSTEKADQSPLMITKASNSKPRFSTAVMSNKETGDVRKKRLAEP